MTNNPMTEQRLVVKRKFPVSPDKVYQAWTQPEQLAKWFAPTPEHSTSLSEVDLRVGGRYCIGIKGPNGNIYTVGGTYEEIDPMKKLVFTWAWESEGEFKGIQTRVTVELAEIKEGTELTLTHEKIPSEKMAEEHTKGWNGCLDSCVQYLSK